MLQEGVEWFGQPSERVSAQIFRADGPTIVPDAESASRSTAAELIRAADLVPSFIGDRGSLAVVDQQSPVASTQVARGTSVILRMMALYDQTPIGQPDR
jgi:hypothetical protein